MRAVILNSLPFGDLEFVGSVQYREFPTTMVFSDASKRTFVLEWADLLDDNHTNRYYLYEVRKSDLKAYLDCVKTHIELIRSSVDLGVYLFDGALDSPNNVQFITLGNLRTDYLPKPNVKFDANETEDLDEIIEFFSLDNVESSDSKIDIQPISVERNTELINLHLLSGKRVSFGKAQSRTLGTILCNFDDFYHEVAVDISSGKERNRKLNKEEKLALDELSYTEVVLHMAASYSVYLKPLNSQVAGFVLDTNGETMSYSSDAEVVFSEVISLIQNTQEVDEINAKLQSHSKAVFQSLEKLLKSVKDNNVELNLEYYNPVSKTHIKPFLIDRNFVSIAIANLPSDVLSKEPPVKLEGKFTALNCRTGHFDFEDSDGESYSGYLDKPIRPSISTLNFSDTYQIMLKIKWVNSSNDDGVKHVDTLIISLVWS